MSLLSKLKLPAFGSNSSQHLLKFQLAKFTRKSLHVKRLQKFDLNKSIHLFSQTLPPIMSIDIGGTKILSAEYEMKNGDFHITHLQKEQNSDTYLSFLQEIAKFARQREIPVSVSFAGPIHETKPIEGPNVTQLIYDITRMYEGDFAHLFPTLKSLSNDAVAGLAAGASAAKKKYPTIQNVLYLINGSGIGGAVLKNDTVYAIEPGHVEIIPELNIFEQTKPCGMFGANYICIESVAAGKAGIEAAWSRQKYEELTGELIARKMKHGDSFAISLYDHSALMMTYVAVGIMKVFDLSYTNTAIVLHGGVFLTEGYTDKIKQYLEHELENEYMVLPTSEFSQNACLDGASIMGWMA